MTFELNLWVQRAFKFFFRLSLNIMWRSCFEGEFKTHDSVDSRWKKKAKKEFYYKTKWFKSLKQNNIFSFAKGSDWETHKWVRGLFRPTTISVPNLTTFLQTVLRAVRLPARRRMKRMATKTAGTHNFTAQPITVTVKGFNFVSFMFCIDIWKFYH